MHRCTGRRGTSITNPNALAYAITSSCSAWQHHGNCMANVGQLHGMICVIFGWATLPTGAFSLLPTPPQGQLLCGVDARNKSAQHGINL